MGTIINLYVIPRKQSPNDLRAAQVVGWMRPIRLSETILAATPAGNAPSEFRRFPVGFGCCSYPSFVMILYLMRQYSMGPSRRKICAMARHLSWVLS